MKIVSYNVNGIRAALKKGLFEWVKEEKIDILCLQEVKANEGQVDLTAFRKLGYHIYWEPAAKKGYSGVAIMSLESPVAVVHGAQHEIFDSEGRFLRLIYKNWVIQNVYIPSGSSKEERQALKMKFLDFFLPYCIGLKEEYKNLIVCGDFNICHKAIDIHNPVANKNSSGFLPEEREWVDQFIEAGFVDSFRHFNKEPHQYSWWTYRAGARDKNKGWRIDYHMVSEEFVPKLRNASILQNIKHSDHCPVVVQIQD